MAKPTYEELAEALEILLADTICDDEPVAPEKVEWERAYNIWEATGVTPNYFGFWYSSR